MAEPRSVEDWARHLGIDPSAPDEVDDAPPASTNGHGARPGWQRVEPLSALEPVVAGCDFVRWCRDHQPEVSEPLWHSLLSNLARCEGGREAAHAFSRDYPGYSPRETDEKFDHARRGSKPITCARIQELGFEGCPPGGHGVTAPVALGWPREPQPETPACAPDGPKVLIGAEIAAAEVVETEWIIDALFSARHQHGLLGASESAKTWALWDLGLSISHPRIETFLGQPIRQHGRVVIESWEQDQAEDLRRLHKLALGHGLALGEAFEHLILLSETPTSLNDPDYFALRLRELQEWGALTYCVDSLSLASGIDLNDNTVYSGWWQTRIRPILNAGIMVVFTHLTGHLKPGVGRTRDSVVRGATQIRALSTQMVEFRQQGDTRFGVHHNKHRNATGLKFGTLTLDGELADPWCRLTLTADQPLPEGGKDALARQKLIDLGTDRPSVWLTIKAIDAVLNPTDKPPKDRVSTKTWRPVVDQMAGEGLVKVGKAGKALAWRFLPPADLPEDDEEDDPSLL